MQAFGSRISCCRKLETLLLRLFSHLVLLAGVRAVVTIKIQRGAPAAYVIVIKNTLRSSGVRSGRLETRRGAVQDDSLDAQDLRDLIAIATAWQGIDNLQFGEAQFTLVDRTLKKLSLTKVISLP
jgi:hypothetical protein